MHSSRSTSIALGLGAAALVVACAPALTAADCAGPGEGAFDDGAPIDARAGVVAWDARGESGAGPVTRRSFLECSSGTGIRVTTQSGGETVRQEVDALTFSVVEGDRMTQFRDGLSLMGIGFSTISYPGETCGCQVFYPGDRGTRKQYEATV